ncbi:MAG: hypothetical protein Q4D79_06635 [Propionibacteriaceae bacterium]|nr:hypothetical protein [Propionibacteriaceae bacterium]
MPRSAAELNRLRREVAELRKDNEFQGLAAAYFRVEATAVERFELMDAGEGEIFEIARMARLLGVSCSGYYQWRAKTLAGPGPQARRRAVLDARVRALHTASDRVYGAPLDRRRSPPGGLAGECEDRGRVAAPPRDWRASVPARFGR